MQNNSTWSRVWDAPNALSLWKQYYFPSCPWCGSMDIYQVLVICGVPWLLMFCSYFFNVYFTGSWVPHSWMEAVLDVWIYQSFISRSDSIAKPFFWSWYIRSWSSWGSLAALITCRACKFHKYILSVYLVVEINKRIWLMLTCTKVFLLVPYGVSWSYLIFFNKDREHSLFIELEDTCFLL